jgi:hypothetical protein
MIGKGLIRLLLACEVNPRAGPLVEAEDLHGLFVATAYIAADAAEYFGLPIDRTVVMGARSEVERSPIRWRLGLPQTMDARSRSVASASWIARTCCNTWTPGERGSTAKRVDQLGPGCGVPVKIVSNASAMV